MNMTSNSACAVCLQQNPNPYVLGDKEGYVYKACRACGSAQIEPRPSQALLEETMAAIDPQPVHIARPERRIDTIEKILNKNLPKAAAGVNILLDINALHGYTTAAARNVGYQATGLNTWAFMHQFAAKEYGENRFIHASLQDYVATNPVKPNVILSVKAFSQQTGLDAFTKAIKDCLAPNGIVYIEEDDANHLNTPRDLNDWTAIEPPFSVSILSRKGMAKLLARHGLEIRKSHFTWAPYMRMIVGHAK